MENVCCFENCTEKHYGRGYCHKHYQQVKRDGGFSGWPICKSKNCENPVLCKNLCVKHYLRKKKHGDTRVVKKRGAKSVGRRWKRCKTARCGKRAKALGLCHTHYIRELRQGKIHDRICIVEDCSSPELAKGYCSRHWQLWNKYNDTNVRRIVATTPEEKRALATARMRRYRQTKHGKIRSRWSVGKHRTTTGWYVPGATKAQLLSLWDTTVCALCGQAMAEEEKSIDHILPLSKGGGHCLDNLQIAHLNCNRKKRNKV